MRTALAIALCLLAAPAVADDVLLGTGGRISGKLEQLEDGSYRLTTPAGTVVALERSQVSSVSYSSAESENYAARARTAPDTIEAQMALANWCREHNLNSEATKHAERVVELDPTNAEARQMLNFRNVDGEWMTREQMMTSRGLVFHSGKYRTRQEVALLEAEGKHKELTTHWTTEVKKWRRWLGDRRPERVQEAMAAFEQVSDPLAGPPIVELLDSEKDPGIRRMLARAAARINHQSTVNALVLLSLNDPDEELRLSALESLISAGRPGLTEAYVKGLRSNENVVVNRAAMALGSLEDPSAIGPLIDALITKHKKVTGGSSGGDTYSFNPTSGGFSMGGGGPKVTEGRLQNPDVLSALVKLTGEHYSYNQELWKKWHSTQARMVQVDLRRDK